MGQIHALALQLIAKDITALMVSYRTKIGTAKLRQDHLVVTIPMTKQGSTTLPVFMFERSWGGLDIFQP